MGQGEIGDGPGWLDLGGGLNGVICFNWIVNNRKVCCRLAAYEVMSVSKFTFEIRKYIDQLN